MDRSVTPEISIYVSLRYILYPASSSSLSSLLFSKLLNTIPRIEEEIKNDIDKDGSDGEIEIDDKIGNTDVYSRPKDRKYDYI